MPYNSHMRAPNKENLYGIKGWLKFFVFLTILSGCTYFYYAAKSVFIIEQFGSDFSDFYGVILQLIFSIILTVFSLYLVYVIYGRKEYAPKIARFYLAAQPIISSLWISTMLFHSFPSLNKPELFVFFAVLFFSFSINLGHSILWMIYFNESRRVVNTFVVFGKVMPPVILCPVCSETLELDEDERRNKPVICAACGKPVSKDEILLPAELETEQTEGE